MLFRQARDMFTDTDDPEDNVKETCRGVVLLQDLAVMTTWVNCLHVISNLY